ncbi:PTS glucose transporter subunit IIA [Haloimpatiens sp. FM7330]|uniref:PTS sugar transporter subunit IIA n=1 Tax=Haloimpatiens sp. FM7330 TaxID=3298610 RepID=UPI00363C0B0F
MLKNIDVLLPLKGEIIPIIEVEDYLFNKKIMGEGVAIKPKDNFIYSPVDGEVKFISPNNHEILISTKENLEILIHLGLDTAKFDGRGTASYVKSGDIVKKGDKLIFFDREYIGTKASLTTPIVITNTEIMRSLEINYEAISNKDVLMTVII